MVDLLAPIPVEVYALYSAPLFGRHEDLRRFQALMENFSLERMSLIVDDRDIVSAVLEHVPPNKVSEEVTRLLRKPGISTQIHRLVRVRATLKPRHPPTGEASPGVEVTDEFLRGADESYAARQMLKWLHDVSFAMNLASPGALSLASTAAAGEPDAVPFRSQRPLLSHWEYPDDPDWPTIRVLDSKDVWGWLVGLPGWSEGFATDAVTRAVLALLRLTQTGDAAEELLWIMIGLEALFTESDTGLLQQLKQRSQMLLGSSKRGSKQIGELYRVRSKFVHGKLNFAGPHHFQDAMPEYAAYNQTMDEAIATGRRMLIAAVQELVLRRWRTLEYVLSMSGLGST